MKQLLLGSCSQMNHSLQKPPKSLSRWLSPVFLGLLLALVSAFLLGAGNARVVKASASVSRVPTSQISSLQAEAYNLRQQLYQEALAWGSTHIYHDSYDGKTYSFGYEYQAIASYPTNNLLARARSVADYQYVIGQLRGWLADFNAYTANFNDPTPYDQVHATDMRLMWRNGETSGNVIVISLSEQAMRVYQDGRLLNAFQVVTGMPGHASLPGSWVIENKQTNITFTSGKKPGDPDYYPPTPIAIAMQYHSEGYFIHQSWWRRQYGRNMQFPHLDPYGTLFANSGSHGCINMSTPSVEWVYNFVSVNTTKLIIY
jgi:hypothetical protein